MAIPASVFLCMTFTDFSRSLFAACLISVAPVSVAGELSDWTFHFPRPEAKPKHQFSPSAGRDGSASLVIETGPGRHWMGHWSQTRPVTGGAHYQFCASRKIETQSVDLCGGASMPESFGRTPRANPSPGNNPPRPATPSARFPGRNPNTRATLAARRAIEADSRTSCARHFRPDRRASSCISSGCQTPV
jgi:hypothetical protein